jgi:hypothetical protein
LEDKKQELKLHTNRVKNNFGYPMSETTLLDQALNESERQVLNQLTSPIKIQKFLDDLTYSADPFYRCPLRVFRDCLAHCFDGALFAAATLRRLGYPPLILDMIPNDRDDDHLLALYKYERYWGAVAKSNFVGLRFREPVYRNLRELAISYFEQYYNVAGEKTLRGYTVPLNLKTFDKWNWMTVDDHLERIAERLDTIRRIPLLTSSMIDNLSKIDDRSHKAGLLFVNEAGLFKPPE